MESAFFRNNNPNFLYFNENERMNGLYDVFINGDKIKIYPEEQHKKIIQLISPLCLVRWLRKMSVLQKGKKVEFDHNMLWFGVKKGQKSEQKMHDFDPYFL
ncbi:hypothetical protein [Sedimentibacter sp.]|uniref:hypothetical protein n=1 Tax=Sedimentibacter sp. TaxID=1960295 RepID=UPI0028AD734F|nr:hypothetical protein [Sedimentibacter sp.]